MTKKQLEEKYGIRIEDDSYWNPFNNRYIKQYRMYAADGCQWENGIPTIKACEAECRTWEDELLKIKEICNHD